MSRAGLGLQMLVLVVLCGLIERELGTERLASLTPPASESIVPAMGQRPSERFSLPPLAEFSAVVGRPLFASTRRPTPPVSPEQPPAALARAPVAPPAPDVGPFILSAIVIVEDQRAALVTDPGNGQLTRRREGDLLGAWALAEIRPDSVVLRYGEETREVPLRRFDDPGPAPARASAPRTQVENMATLLQQHLQQKTEKIKRLQAQIGELENVPPSPDAVTAPDESCGLSRC